MNNIESIKKNTNFLKMDTNSKHDYKMVKTFKSIFNVPKHQLEELSNTSVLDYVVVPKNDYISKFGQYKYIDFDLPSEKLCYYQFLLRFTLTNNN